MKWLGSSTLISGGVTNDEANASTSIDLSARLLRIVAHPPRSSCSSWAAGTSSVSRMQSVARAAAAEQAAVSQTTSIGSSTVIRKPATPGPARNATPNMVWKPPATLSTCTPEVVDTSASSACRAVMPGTSKTAPATPRATNHDSESPNVASTPAIAATERALPTSAATATLRWPNRSVSRPAKNVAGTDAMPAAAATTAAADGSPVRLMTNQGRTIAIAALPNSESPAPLR